MLEGMQLRSSLDSLASPRRPRLEIDTSADFRRFIVRDDSLLLRRPQGFGRERRQPAQLITNRMPAANAAIVPAMKPTEPFLRLLPGLLLADLVDDGRHFPHPSLGGRFTPFLLSLY